MKYVLIGSVTSPYVRKMRLFLKDLAPYDFKAINYLEKNDSDYLKSVNPINKIPLLIDGNQTIFDSRVIFNHLSKKHGLQPLTIDQENILSAIDGAMDTSINLFSLRRGGLDITKGDNPFIERQIERVPLIINFLKPWLSNLDPQNPKDWNFVSMSAYCYFYWANFRDILDLSPYPEVELFLKKFKNMPGIDETNIPT